MKLKETCTERSGALSPSKGRSIARGRFALQEPLGEGRFAVVYRAQDMHLRRPIALKLLREEHINGDPKWREAFDIEVDLLKMLADVPTVITLIDHGLAADGRPYISLELLPTGTDLLSRVTRQGGFSERDGLPLAWQLTDLLCTAHARGIAYRDMKLEHIFWSDGRMTLIDWNVSRQFSTEGMTLGQGLMTTAPEPRLSHETFGERDERERNFQNDLFKLGTMFYSLFTGLDIRDRQVPTPVYSQLEESGFSLTDEGIVWPIDFADTPLSPELKDIICRLVHIDPDQRYQTAAAVCGALEGHAQRLGIALVRPTKLPIERLSPTSTRSLEGWLTRLQQWLGRSKEIRP